MNSKAPENSIALIDADIVAYQEAVKHQSEFNASFDDDEDDEEETGTISDAGAAYDAVRSLVKTILKKTKCRYPVFCFTGKDVFRYKVYPEYKAHRPKTKPPLFKPIKEYLHSMGVCMISPTLEADDLLGIMATRTEPFGRRYVIASIDKDLLQIPGTHYNWRKDVISTVTPAQGDYLFYSQVLIGDSSDNYKGCPGIGPAKAKKILGPCPTKYRDEKHYMRLNIRWWTAVLEAYDDHGLDQTKAIEQARLARILRAEDWNDETSEVTLWEPTFSSSRFVG